MSFRRDGKAHHQDQRDWDAWKYAHADLIAACGLPPGIFRSRGDWEYLMQYGYWCEAYYGAYVGNIDFDLSELNPEQKNAFRQLLECTLTDQERLRGCAAWHHVCPPSGRDQE